MKNLTLTFWPKIFFEVNIHVEKPGKKFGTKSIRGKSSCKLAIYHIENLFVNSRQKAIATTNVAQSNYMDMTSCTATIYLNQLTIRDWKDSLQRARG